MLVIAISLTKHLEALFCSPIETPRSIIEIFIFFFTQAVPSPSTTVNRVFFLLYIDRSTALALHITKFKETWWIDSEVMAANNNSYAPFTEQTFQQFTEWLNSPDHKNRV